MYVLIVITYLAGPGTWGPEVTFGEFSSQKTCKAAEVHVLESIKEMNKSNLLNPGTQREMVRAKCQQK